jgi:hypothetical protein
VLFAKAARRVRQPRLVQFLGEPVEWIQTARYLGATLDTRLTLSAHVNQVRKRAAQRLGMLGPLLNRRIGLSVRNCVLLYKQLIHPKMEYACPIWRSAARSQVRKLQVLQSRCLRIATNAALYVGKKQIHEDLGIPFFADHIRALAESFDLKLADAGDPLVRQLGRHLCRPTAGWSHPGNRGELMSSRPAEAFPQKTAKLAQRVVLWLLGCPDCGFPCLTSVVMRMPGHNWKGARPASPSRRPSAKATPTLPRSIPKKTIQPKSFR